MIIISKPVLLFGSFTLIGDGLTMMSNHGPTSQVFNKSEAISWVNSFNESSFLVQDLTSKCTTTSRRIKRKDSSFEKKINKAVLNEINHFKDIQSVDAIRAAIIPVIREKVKAQEENKILHGDLGYMKNTIIEIGVISHIRRLLEAFIDKFCKMIESVREAAKKVPDPEEAAIPSRLIRERDEASSRERPVKQKYIATFKFIYRQTVAILEAAESGDLEKNDAVKRFRDSLTEDNMVKIEDIALATAELNSQLSSLILKESLENKVDWNDEDAVLNALRTWKLDGGNNMKIARAFHRMSTTVQSS